MTLDTADFKRFNMPALLSRQVKKVDPVDPTKWVRDKDWYQEIREKYFYLFRFLEENELSKRPLPRRVEDVDEVVVFDSDLTDVGRALLKSGAVERWLKSFDKPGSKKQWANVSYLIEALRKIS